MLGAFAAGLSVLACMCTFLLLRKRSRRPQKEATAGGTGDGQAVSRLEQPEVRGTALPECPHLQGCFDPQSGLLSSNAKEPSAFETPVSSGLFLALHRPTYDKVLDASGDYPYSEVFAGKSNNWEMRIQLRFKETPSGTLMFGIELDRYVPMMQSTKYLMGKVVCALKWFVGDELYHSVGEDPSRTDDEAEKPIFAMPLWAFDQVIVTPGGKQAPKLTDPDLQRMSLSREEITKLELTAGPTYTLCFSSISAFLDVIQWQVSGAIPGVAIGFDRFCGAPPVHVAIYTLQPGEDTRHTQSRKTYYFQLTFWSSLHPPGKERLQQILQPGTCQEGDVTTVTAAKAASKGAPAVSVGPGCCLEGLAALGMRPRKAAKLPRLLGHFGAAKQKALKQAAHSALPF
eukprot:TRINITY_DN3307_c0_g1_i1.p1 TRINITY_DN3307_c0_g1~~TRINITY_DN3307_c0_g1_i1.p1  ORF type:complete len:417 (-),score=93.56 TRINITY_DN3307_c0_g1_i1:139-1338(-)